MTTAAVPIPLNLPTASGVRLYRLSGREAPFYLDQAKTQGPLYYAQVGSFTTLWADVGTYELRTTPPGGAIVITTVSVGVGETPAPSVGDLITGDQLEASLAAVRDEFVALYAAKHLPETIDGLWTFSTPPLGVGAAASIPDGTYVTPQQLADALTLIGTTFVHSAGGTVAGDLNITGTLSVNGTPVTTTAPTSDPSRYQLLGNVPGGLNVGDLFDGGVDVLSPISPTGLLIHAQQVPLGSAALFEFRVVRRVDGVTVTTGTLASMAAGTRRAYLALTGLNLVAGDTMYVRCTQFGSSQPGVGMRVAIFGSSTTAPAALAAPAPVTGLTAAVSGAQDVRVAWTLPTPTPTTVRSAVHLYRDGTWYAELDRMATSYVDVGEQSNAHDYAVMTVNLDAGSSQVVVSYAPTGTITTTTFAGAHQDAQGASMTVPVTAPVAAGRTAFLTLAASGPVGQSTMPAIAVTDSVGNTWTLVPGSVSYLASGTMATLIYRCDLTTALTTAHSIAVSAGTVQFARMTASARYVNGTVGAVDQVVIGNSGTAGKAYTTPDTAPLAQAKEYVIAVLSSFVGTVGFGAPLAVAATVTTTAGVNERQGTTAESITSTAGALSPTASNTLASAYAMSVATFRVS